jgi:hypothetical protein
MIHRYTITNLILDYLKTDDLKKISAYEINKTVNDLIELKVENFIDIYNYVDAKFNLNYRCTQ